jgi:hypothetical protein
MAAIAYDGRRYHYVPLRVNSTVSNNVAISTAGQDRYYNNTANITNSTISGNNCSA